MNKINYFLDREYDRIRNGGNCVYCGRDATGWDHFFPLCYARVLLHIERARSALFLLECCTKCNTYVGSRPSWDFAERATKVQIKGTRWLPENNKCIGILTQIKLDPLALADENIVWPRLHRSSLVYWLESPEVQTKISLAKSVPIGHAPNA